MTEVTGGQWLLAYIAVGFLTAVGMAVVDLRAGRRDPGLWWLIIWPVYVMWPFTIGEVICDLIDGPYRPKHRVEYY